jgi:UDP-glucose 4-epimerase
VRCLVTGASGFIGSQLVRLLLDHGADVAVLLRPGIPAWRLKDDLARVQILWGDLAAIEQVAAECIAFAPEVMFHLAWDGVGRPHRDDPQQFARNLPGTIKLLEIARKAGCRRWVGLGSQAEYGPYEWELTEDLPAKPTTAYGLAKLCSCVLTERLCQWYGIEWAWLRLVAAYGPMQIGDALIPDVIRTLLTGERPLLTAGAQRVDYLFVEDVAEALYAVATMDGATGLYNLGCGQAVPVRSVVERLRDRIDPRLPLGFGDLPYGAEQPMLLQANVSRLVKATGWAPRVDLDAGLQRTVDWFSSREEYAGRGM